MSKPRTREQHRQYAENYRKAHPERYRAQRAKYRAENRERVNEWSRRASAKGRAEHPEKDREYHERWKAKDPGHVHKLGASRQIAYRKRHPVRVEAAKKKAYADLSPERAKDWALKVRYGKAFGLAQYQVLLDQQNGVCAICGNPETAPAKPAAKRRSGPGIKRLSVDHCHGSGKIRGLLCTNCNSGIGRFKDNADLLLAAAEYLKRGNRV